MATQKKPAEQRDHGRNASRPGEIPSSGWKDIFFRVKSEVYDDNLSIIAAGVAFYGFLAIFPAIAAFVAIYGLVVSPSEVQSQLSSIQSILPSEASNLITGQLQRITSSAHSQLGWTLVGSVLLALWSAAKGMKALIEAMNITYDEEEKRGFIRLNLTAVLLTIGAMIGVILFIGLIALLPAILATVGLGAAGELIIQIVRWPFLAAVGVFGLALLYRFAPSRDEPQWKWVSWGAVIATILWLIGSALFSVYVANFSSYDKTYGSLGVVVILMMWFFLSAYTVLLGSEINAEMEHQTAKDTTVGEAEPRGRRQAYVADTVGKRHGS